MSPLFFDYLLFCRQYYSYTNIQLLSKIKLFSYIYENCKDFCLYFNCRLVLITLTLIIARIRKDGHIMVSVILAGGDGTRMRPLTCSIPKAMLTVCGKTLLEYAVDKLSINGFQKCIITADYLSSQLTDTYDELASKGTDIDFSVIQSPCGTTSAISNALSKVINGALIMPCDCLNNFNLSDCEKYHKYNNADITLIVQKNVRNSDYPAVNINEKNHVSSIVINPAVQNVIDIPVLTGVCILSEKAVRSLSGYDGDLYTETIPQLIKKGLNVCAYEDMGYYIDINTPDDLLTAQSAVLYKKFDVWSENIRRIAEENIEQPVYIDKSAQIDKGALISAGSVICKNVTIEKGAKVHGSLVLDGAYIGERTSVNNAVIGMSARILSSAGVFEGAVIGENAVICNGAVVNPGIKIWNGRHLESDTNAVTDVKYGFAKPLRMDDEGICGETNGIITPQIASVLGSCAVSVGEKVGVGYRGTNASQALALAFASGVMSSGGECWMLGESTEPEFASGVKNCMLDISCYIEAGITAKIKFVSSDGLPLTRQQERIIESGLNRNEYRRSGFTHFGTIKQCSGVNELYKLSLRHALPEKLNGINVSVNTSEPRIAEICNELLAKINDKNGERLVFHISSDGKKISAYTEETGYVFYEKLILLCCLKCFQLGIDISLPHSFPTAADNLAVQYGRKVMRYSSYYSDGTDIEARKVAQTLPFTTDATMLMLTVLDILTANRCTLKEAVSALPTFSATARFVPLEGNPSQALKKLCSTTPIGGDGVVFSDNRGRVLIRPVRTGKGAMMFVESYAAETAGEICDFYYDMLTHMKAD